MVGPEGAESEDLLDDDFESQIKSFIAADDGSIEAELPTTEGQTQAPATEQPSDRGDGRDEKGRFAPQGATADTPKDPSTTPPAQAEAAKTDPSTVPPAVAATPPAVVDPNAPVVQTAPIEEPFVVKYGNASYEIPGSKVTADGVFIPKDQHDLVREYVGNGIKYKAERQDIKAAKIQANRAAAEGRALNQGFATQVEHLMKIAEIPEDEPFAIEMLKFGLQLRADLPLLRERQQWAKEKAELEFQREMGQPEPEEQRVQFEQAAEQALAWNIGEMRKVPEFSTLSDQDIKEIEGMVQQSPLLVYYQVGQHPTQAESAAGARPGEWVLAADRLAGLARPYARARNAVKSEMERAQKAIQDSQKVADSNARKLAQLAPQPVQGGVPDEPAKKPKKESESWEDFEDEVERGIKEALKS